MNKELAESFLQSDGLLEQLGEVINEAINNDDEALYKKARNLVDLYLEHPDVVDEVMMSLTGWTMESLMEEV